MSNADSTNGSTPQPDPKCPYKNSGMIYLVLDAPAAKDGEPAPSSSSLPKHFRTMTDNWYRQPGPTQPSRVGLDTLNASGSAQFCKGQLQAMLNHPPVKLPLTIVDLRQESHGFLTIGQAIANESTIAVGWFAERDWMNIGKDLVGITWDENLRLYSCKSNQDLKVLEIKSETKEGGVCTGKEYPVQLTDWTTEQQLATSVGVGYQRYPTSDHVKPRDAEVDQFVAFDTSLPKGTWLHFHCRGGDGRTTTFLAMHDILNNAPQVSVDDILLRQYWLGGVDLDNTQPGDTTSFKYPFAVERAYFIRSFYTYVVDEKPGGFTTTWSTWLAANTVQPTLAASSV